MVTGTPCAGNLVDSRLKELLPPLPVIYVKAVPVQVCRSTHSIGMLPMEWFLTNDHFNFLTELMFSHRDIVCSSCSLKAFSTSIPHTYVLRIDSLCSRRRPQLTSDVLGAFPCAKFSYALLLFTLLKTERESEKLWSPTTHSHSACTLSHRIH